MDQNKERDGNFVTMEIVSNLEAALWFVGSESLPKVKSKQWIVVPMGISAPCKPVSCCEKRTTSRNPSTGLSNADGLGVVS